MNEELISRKEAAALAGVAYPTIAQWQRKGWIDTVPRGREQMTTRSSLERHMANRSKKAGQRSPKHKPSATPSRLLVVVPNTVRGEVVIVIGAA